MEIARPGAEAAPCVALLVAGPLAARTGGSIYNRRMAEALKGLGWTVDVHELGGTFPEPDDRAREAAARTLASLPDDAVAVVDGLAFSALADEVEREAARLRLVALIHLPLAAAVDLDRVRAERYAASERRALAAARAVVVTGEAALPMLGSCAVPASRLTVIEPGTDREAPARGSGGPAVALLSVGAVSRGKGHDALIRAVAAVDGRSGTGDAHAASPWHLTCAGSLTRDRDAAAHARTLAERLGVADRVTFAGELEGEALARAYDRADVFVLATRQETYGMAVAEALARGLPVVATSVGAIPAIVGDAAGIVVPADDVAALARALRLVIDDPALRARLGAGARAAGHRLPTWDDAARQMAQVLARVTQHG